MRTLELTATAGISSTFSHASSSGTALIDFVDNLIVNAEGVAPGTDLIVEVTWIIEGNTEFNGPDRIRNRSKILLEA
ncbi:MAG: hypothetical protein GWO24_33545, partial [Akkermansiaceae bacterium]|nr:hypothetical protein [Akkermansiaceae bacterium]